MVKAPGGEERNSVAPKRPRVRRNVTAQIGADICMEHYPPGTPLPRENDLGTLYGVSRTVIREALKVLETKGLVRGRPRIGTVVCDREEWNILDPQILEWMGPGALAVDLLRSILESRRTVEPAAAALAAERASAQEIADLERACDEMGEAGDDLEAFTIADARFHDTLMRASHNQVFRQLSSIIQAALAYSLKASNQAAGKHDEALAAHRALVEALRLRDGVLAQTCSTRILDLAARDLSTVMRPSGAR